MHRFKKKIYKTSLFLKRNKVIFIRSSFFCFTWPPVKEVFNFFLSKPIRELEKEILRGQSFQGPLIAKEIYEMLEKKDMLNRWVKVSKVSVEVYLNFSEKSKNLSLFSYKHVCMFFFVLTALYKQQKLTWTTSVVEIFNLITLLKGSNKSHSLSSFMNIYKYFHILCSLVFNCHRINKSNSLTDFNNTDADKPHLNCF